MTIELIEKSKMVSTSRTRKNENVINLKGLCKIPHISKDKEIEAVEIGDIITLPFDKDIAPLSDQYIRRRKTKYRNLQEDTKLITPKELISHRRIIKKDVVLSGIIYQKKIDKAITILKDGKIEEYDHNIFKLLVYKRQDIYEKTGHLIPLKTMIEDIIKRGMKGVNENTI